MRIVYFILFICLLFSCKNESSLADLDPEGDSRFSIKKAEDSGLNFVNQLNPTPKKNILEYLYYYNGGGVGIGDFNGDGLEDVFFTANESSDKLFFNKGNLQFEEREVGIIADNNWSSGVTVDDVNNDGHLDIYVCRVGPFSQEGTHNLLYINDGTGAFKEMSATYGLDFSGYSTHASFFDYDQDGDLDMYLLNHSVHSVRSYGKIEKRNTTDPLAGDRMYENKLNEEAASFVDVTKQSKIYSSPMGYGLSVTTGDVNGDGKIDIYVANDFHENDYIYLNQGDKTFVESSASLLAHGSKFSMGVDLMDMNNDGREDLFTTDMLPYDKKVALKSGGEDTDQIFNIRSDFGFQDQFARNHFQIQNSDNSFSDIGLMTDTYATDWSWACLLQDFDNNGKNDIFISNGIVKRPNDLDYIKYINQNEKALNSNLDQNALNSILDVMPSEKLHNILFYQSGNLRFSSVNNSKVGIPTFSNGAAYADLDNDGDLDLLTNNINDSASLYVNNSSEESHYVSFEVKGTDAHNQKNTSVKLYTKDGVQLKSNRTVRGYQSSVTNRIHFGLAETSVIDSAFLISSNGLTKKIHDVKVDALNKVDLGGLSKSSMRKEDNEKVFTIKELDYSHQENSIQDYNNDKLIPELLSREGPALETFDCNGDGIMDIFLGGGRHQQAQLLLGDKRGNYIPLAIKGFIGDSKYEDVAAKAFDFDSDGDLDLYIVSGGNDAKELDKLMEDRIYLNNGNGDFKRLPLSLPHTNGSCVTAADFDGDGFQDLFIGARSIPYSYGLSPYSFILRNRGNFTFEIAHKERYGMLTDSEAVDVDGDGDMDLVLCGDWMPITIVENKGERTYERGSAKYGLENSTGLWNRVLVSDFNKDGKPDFVAANAGLNFKWKASEDSPVKMFVADLDKNGQTEPIIFQEYFGGYKPFHSLDALISQAPVLKKQYIGYEDFSEVESVSDFKAFNADEIVEQKELKELSSCLFLSSDGIYKKVRLPEKVQWSTVQDMVIDAEGNLICVANHKEYLTELGGSLSNSGSLLTDFNSQTGKFESYKSLHLPVAFNSRNISKLSTGKYIVTSNDDVPVILSKK